MSSHFHFWNCSHNLVPKVCLNIIFPNNKCPNIQIHACCNVLVICRHLVPHNKCYFDNAASQSHSLSLSLASRFSFISSRRVGFRIVFAVITLLSSCSGPTIVCRGTLALRSMHQHFLSLFLLSSSIMTQEWQECWMELSELDIVRKQRKVNLITKKSNWFENW